MTLSTLVLHFPPLPELELSVSGERFWFVVSIFLPPFSNKKGFLDMLTLHKMLSDVTQYLDILCELGPCVLIHFFFFSAVPCGLLSRCWFSTCLLSVVYQNWKFPNPSSLSVVPTPPTPLPSALFSF